MTQEKLSQSTSTLLQAGLTQEEIPYWLSLPDELSKMLTLEDSKIMMRLPPDQWETKLIKTVMPFMDEEDQADLMAILRSRGQ
jgi:hypothetical protein